LGGAADDSLSSTGSSTISGGFGNDTLSGTGGSNTYLYSIGDGTDHINDTSAKTDGQGNPTPNTLSFGAGVFASDLRLGVGSNALTC
jgi:Ca2+-binding RTX toxin-like protein